MKTLLPILLFLAFSATAQITTPIIKAGFGVDADLRSKFFNSSLQNGNDDWFFLPGTPGNLGESVIDTTGAAAIVAAYNSDASPYAVRMSSFFRTMSKPQFSIVNNRLWLDALFVRDYHGTDTTVFTSGSNKNGMSPATWTSGIQNIPDKNDILDMFMHVRRAGPTKTDSLWLFGGLSLDNTTGNRYFDFEMYQTDIYYDRASGKWFGYGPDEGHTSWEFDAAGNVVKPGDIIFSSEYQSSTLTKVEARIWVNKAALSTTPTSFVWSGGFDGASSSSQYGYASILPKTAGSFYTGLGSGNKTWAGPFQVVLQDNSLRPEYTRDQFMEFSVNLTKLGLDPVTTFGTDICGTPFNRMVVKTRSSASFTSELKDFVAPTDLFLAPRVNALADVPLFCGVLGVSNLLIQNPSLSSVYTWTTTDGNIVGTNTGADITVDKPGTYVVMQQLAAGCNAYAYDTVAIVYDAACVPMSQSLTKFTGTLNSGVARLRWTTKTNAEVLYFELERSYNGVDFTPVKKVAQVPSGTNEGQYASFDDMSGLHATTLYYRVRIVSTKGAVSYSNTIVLKLPEINGTVLFPNPVNSVLNVSVNSSQRDQATVSVFSMTGALVKLQSFAVKQGRNILQLDAAQWPTGTYLVHIQTSRENVWKKIMVADALTNK
jgi:hypothetical protein